jgi:tripartite-type tricarboxylate transporter receptor subunit TctC
MAAELFKRRAHVDFRLIPYKGDAQLATDVIGGQVDLAFMTVAIAAPQVRAGRIKAIAVIGRTRSKSLPDVPTMDEAGLPGFYADGWYGLMAPAHTPEAVVQRLSTALLAGIAQPAFQDKLSAMGLSAVGSTPQDFNAFLGVERARMEQVIREAHIHIE